MGLDFTTIKDHEGAAIYLIHDGSSMQERKMEHLAHRLEGRTKHQIVIISARDDNGRKIIDFYHLVGHGKNFVLIVRDNDQLAYQWPGTEIPSAEQIAYMTSQVG